eukprot:INCI16326.4.p1 GENE.INCI16326.4~~INCI16326.4.p1  ORF type:complete len:650 (-),score=140.37 INCI16326.4:879-2564(-)
MYNARGQIPLDDMTPFQAKKILRDAGADVEGDKTAVMERLNSILRRSGAAQDSSPLVDSQSASIAVAGSARPVQSKALDSLPLPQQAAVEAVQSGEVNSMSPFKLKKLLRDNTLEVNGSKAELKARLEAFVGTVAGQEQDANGDNSRNEQSGDDSAGAAEAVAAAAESEDDTASTEVMTAAAFSPGGAPGGDSEELLNIPATITRTTSGAGPATPPPEDDEEAEDPDALKGNLVAASLDLGERLAGKDVRTMAKEELTQMAVDLKRKYGGETAKEAMSAAFARNVRENVLAKNRAAQRELEIQAAREQQRRAGRKIVMPDDIGKTKGRAAQLGSARSSQGMDVAVPSASAAAAEHGLGTMVTMLEDLMLRRPPQYFFAQNLRDLQAGGSFQYVSVNMYPSHYGDMYRRAVEDPSAVLEDPSLSTTLMIKVDRTSLRDFILSSGDSPTPHAIERWSDDLKPNRSLLNEVSLHFTSACVLFLFCVACSEFCLPRFWCRWSTGIGWCLGMWFWLLVNYPSRVHPMKPYRSGLTIIHPSQICPTLCARVKLTVTKTMMTPSETVD